MKLPKVSRLHRRAILIYAGTIVLPAGILLWLGLQSFQRQRQALETLTAERLTRELHDRTHAAAETALAEGRHPVATMFFTMEHGVMVRPALRAPLPEDVPEDFAEADRQEFERMRLDLALESYRRLFDSHPRKSLALYGIARTLTKLGRNDQAREAWRRLAASYPDDRDLSHRPYGIIAAIEAGDTAGLYEAIASGRWELSADRAEHFLTELDPERTTPYLEELRLAREIHERFPSAGAPRENDLYTFEFDSHRIFYRADGPQRIIGFAADTDWIERTLRPEIERELGIAGRARQDQFIYGAAIALVLMIVSAGVLLLLRDLSREARTTRLRADFVSGVSHELKTPITLIRLYSETLLRHAGFNAEQRTDFHRIIQRESERLGQLIDRVLTFSSVERGEKVYRLEEGDLAPAIAAIVEDYRQLIERAGFTVTRALPPSTPPVRFDPAALYQAVINLLDNAVKYSEQSRDITVRLNVRPDSVAFEVEDRGVGVSASEQKKIFERFYRAANGSGKGGYGLGLFMVRHIMEAHGGRAEVDSEPGRGSCFRLVFPLAIPCASTASS